MSNLNTCVKTQAGTIVTPKGRLSYAHDMTNANPKNKTRDGKQKYQVTLLIPAGSDLTLLKEDARRALTEKFASMPDHKKASLKSPFLDAYEKTGDEAFKGWTMIRVSTTTPPGIVDARGNHVTDVATEVYSGRWARLSVRAGAYEADGNRGVSFFLSNCQLLDHDEPLGGGRARPENEFVPVDIGDSAGGGSAEDLFG